MMTHDTGPRFGGGKVEVVEERTDPEAPEGIERTLECNRNLAAKKDIHPRKPFALQSAICFVLVESYAESTRKSIDVLD
jgi:hypothetical protein